MRTMDREEVEELTYRDLHTTMAQPDRMPESSRAVAFVGAEPARNGETNLEELFGRIKRKLSQPFANMEQYMSQVSNAYSSRGTKQKRNRQKRHSVHGDLPVKYQVHERIELAHFDNMFSDVKNLRDKKHMFKLGIGHDFSLTPITNPAFCDYCRDPIWGMTKKCLRCSSRYCYA